MLCGSEDGRRRRGVRACYDMPERHGHALSEAFGASACPGHLQMLAERYKEATRHEKLGWSKGIHGVPKRVSKYGRHAHVNLHLGLAGGVIVKGTDERESSFEEGIQGMPKLDHFCTLNWFLHFIRCLHTRCLVKWPQETFC